MSNDKVMVLLKGMSGLPVKQAVNMLEGFAPAEIREFLVSSGVIDNPRKLREVTEASLTMTGGEEYSGIIAVLEPAEISAIISSSPEIFSEDLSDVVKPDDYDDSSKWVFLTAAQHAAIRNEGDQRVIRRLFNFHPEPWTMKGREAGPWGLYREDVKIFPETVAAYFSAIVNAPNASEWKEEAVRAIGVDLLAYCVGFIPGIYAHCEEHFPSVARNIVAVRARGVNREIALTGYRETVERLQAELQSEGVTIPNGELSDLLAELRAVGVYNPTAEEVKQTIENGLLLEAAHKSGLPE